MNNKNTLLWLVDTQKDFMNEDGLLYVQGAEAIKPILEQLTQFAKNNDMKVVNTADWHYEYSEELSNNPDFLNTFPKHCMSNTPGVCYINETTPSDSTNITFRWDAKKYSDKFIEEGVDRLREIIITKDKFDVFSGNKYTDKITKSLKNIGFTDIIIAGVATNVCVAFAVNGLLERGFNVTVIENGIKELPDITSPVEEWKTKGVKLINFNELKTIYNYG